MAPIVAATLGLLAFMLAFTFGMAASRFEERRQAVLSETNAINTTYLRAALLPDPMSGDTRNLLREYVDVRLKGANPARTAQASYLGWTLCASGSVHGGYRLSRRH